MGLGLLSKLRDFQGEVRERGFGGALLALPAPKLLLLTDASADNAKEELLFRHIVTESEIVDVSRDLFESGFYNQAVEEAFKALDKYVQSKTGLYDQFGVDLVNNAFSPSNPKLIWSNRETPSQKNEHKGYHLIFQGSFTGIRNPVTHEINWISDHQSALDAVLLAQHLLRKAKSAASA
jgi:uncharacterized protein (TIGR02391 family)